jgi:TolA-binding protein
MKFLLAFTVSLLFITGCGSNNAEDSWKEAEQNLREGKVEEAAKNYEDIVNEHPKSEQAPEALFQLASLYQNQMFLNMNPNESYDKSVKMYKEVYNKYPAHEKAPMALFMSGFIEANELRRFESATETYNLFVQKYPDHPLTASAKEELEYMGLTPAEILKNKSGQE